MAALHLIFQHWVITIVLMVTLAGCVDIVIRAWRGKGDRP